MTRRSGSLLRWSLARFAATAAIAAPAACEGRSEPAPSAPVAVPAPAAAPAPAPVPVPAPAPAPTPAPAPAPPASAAGLPSGTRLFKEHWPDGSVKRAYEMRRGADGTYHKNGRYRAYYLDGTLESEGDYRDDERVGIWNFYDEKGAVMRTTDFRSGRSSAGASAPSPPAP